MQRIAIWLLPAEPQASALRAAIQSIAASWSRAAFAPHVTLASALPRTDIDEVLTAIAARHASYALAPIEAHMSGDFKTSAALAFSTSEAHARLRADILAALACDERPRDPHISLTYGAISDAAPIAAATARFAQPILFDAMRAVLYEAPVDSQEKVAAWKLGPRIPLPEQT